MNWKVITIKVKKNPSIVVLFFVFLFYLNNIEKKKEYWSQNENIQWLWDSGCYYSYLPAIFIYQDLSFSYSDSINQKIGQYNAVYLVDEEKGFKFQKTTAGIAFLELPFFGIAHLLALNDEINEPHGFSSIYYKFVFISQFFYGFIGLILLRLIFKRFFNEDVIAFVLLLIALATNMNFYMSYFIHGVANVYSFFLITLFVYLIFRWEDTKSITILAVAAFVLSLGVVARPTIAIFGLFPVLLLFESKIGLLGFWKYLVSKGIHSFIILVGFIVPILGQMVLWKLITGSWFSYGYGEEKFFFDQPHLFKGLFGARNGLFLYALPLLLSIPGFFLWKRSKFYGFSFIIPFLIYIYVVYCWWCWWYGGSFGSRVGIDVYLVFAVFMAIFLSWIYSKVPRWMFILPMILISFFSIRLGNKFADLANNALIHWDSMTWEAYVYLFENDQIQSDYFELLESPDYDNSRLSGTEYPDASILDTERTYSQPLIIERSITQNDSLEIRFSIWGNFVFNGDYVQIHCYNPETEYAINFKITPKNQNAYWNIETMKIPILPQFKNSEIHLQYVYSGKRRCLYKPIELITNKM